MSAVILNFSERRRILLEESDRPFVPDDIVARADGAWGCSSDTMVRLMRWFEQYGYDFDPTCFFEDMVADLCAIIRASTLLNEVQHLPQGSAYWRYLVTVQMGDFNKTKAARLAAEKLPFA